jgi:hypothetical protein
LDRPIIIVGMFASRLPRACACIILEGLIAQSQTLDVDDFTLPLKTFGRGVIWPSALEGHPREALLGFDRDTD